MSTKNSLKVKSIVLFALIFINASLSAQKAKKEKGTWYFGQSIGMNLNYYQGHTQDLNDATFVPTPFTTGEGIKPYASILMEYMPVKKWGFLLNAAYDNRGGTFKDVLAPCDCPASLSTNMSFLAVEPSLKFVPFSTNHLYLFAGPTFLININKSFIYKQLYQTDIHDNFNQTQDTQFAMQVGAGYDIPVSAKSNTTQIVISPFASFQTDLSPRVHLNEAWSIYSFRIGIALKLGSNKKAAPIKESGYPMILPISNSKDLVFSVRAPKILAPIRHVQEVLPLRNSIFFNMGSTEIPERYRRISEFDARNFSEAQIVQNAPNNLGEGRSARQLAIYHHILNITGDRLRSNPTSTIYLVGSSDNNPAEGKLMAANVRNYLVNIFHIDSSRIHLEGRDLPLIPSEQKGAVRELDLLHQGDRRVDIISNASSVLEPVGNRKNRDLVAFDLISIPKDPLDNLVVFTNENASKLVSSWIVQLTDEQGTLKQFGPYTKDVVAISGNTILENSAYGNYKITMVGTKKDGNTVKKESFVSLKKAEATVHEKGYRFSILFEFDQSKSIATYEQFLTKVVGPYLTDQSKVTIHGHTDIIGEEAYNLKLSTDRAKEVQKILEKYVRNYPSRHVSFESIGYGEQEEFAPFDNTFPEERFYNRSVIIDIVSPN